MSPEFNIKQEAQKVELMYKNLYEAKCAELKTLKNEILAVSSELQSLRKESNKGLISSSQQDQEAGTPPRKLASSQMILDAAERLSASKTVKQSHSVMPDDNSSSEEVVQRETNRNLDAPFNLMAEIDAMLKNAPAVKWPTSRDVGRIGDMSKQATLRVGLDDDNDIYVSVHDEDSMASVEFCCPGGGGGTSSKTREALIALMVAMEADNAASPHKDWWAVRNAPAPRKVSDAT